MPRDRAAYRNVRFYDASTATCIGGFYQNGSITEENLIWILSEVFLITDGEHSWTIQHRPSGRTITPSSNPVVLGNYDIYSTGPLQVTDEPWFARLTSHSISGREDQFRLALAAGELMEEYWTLFVVIQTPIIVSQMSCFDGTSDRSDMMATLRDEAYGKERFEMILDSKLKSEITNK
ncbi:predicted protein [Histoplasma mississippiense (nom. inval.)]|uniref:predicted protein n=1 Tax=Ajellomyces capsulatus (strain NAm1 / WU24) TaxID=2059318 RepID=UPI000157C11E|nr:predicted protein [Histoplasma mississippiense (nom. inval.)]EDN07990.1 predicted protein [Histoplasma mississippiense (nom. inval.)]